MESLADLAAWVLPDSSHRSTGMPVCNRMASASLSSSAGARARQTFLVERLPNDNQPGLLLASLKGNLSGIERSGNVFDHFQWVGNRTGLVANRQANPFFSRVNRQYTPHHGWTSTWMRKERNGK